MNSTLIRARHDVLARAPAMRSQILRLTALGRNAMRNGARRNTGQRDPIQTAAAVGQAIRKAAEQMGPDLLQSSALVGVLSAGAVVLLLDHLEAIERAGSKRISPEFLSQCTQAVMSHVLQMLGITTTRVQLAIADRADDLLTPGQVDGMHAVQALLAGPAAHNNAHCGLSAERI